MSSSRSVGTRSICANSSLTQFAAEHVGDCPNQSRWRSEKGASLNRLLALTYKTVPRLFLPTDGHPFLSFAILFFLFLQYPPSNFVSSVSSIAANLTNSSWTVPILIALRQALTSPLAAGRKWRRLCDMLPFSFVTQLERLVRTPPQGIRIRIKAIAG